MQFASALTTGLFFSTFSSPVPMAQAVVDESAFRPVFYGGEASACSGFGRIDAGSKGKAGMLAVRKGPGSEFSETYVLANGDQVWLCDAKNDWLGVVFVPKGAQPSDCGMSETVRYRLPYAGPCNAGWVQRRWVRLVTG